MTAQQACAALSLIFPGRDGSKQSCTASNYRSQRQKNNNNEMCDLCACVHVCACVGEREVKEGLERSPGGQ